jgi:hypothetical protein
MNTGGFFWEDCLSQRGQRLVDVRRMTKDETRGASLLDSKIRIPS